MAIVCPSCDARFREPPAEIMETRKLQCSKCDHEWKAERPEQGPKDNEEQSDTEVPTVEAPPLAPSMDDLTGPSKDAIRTALPVIMPGAEGPPKPLFVDREDPAPAKSGWGAAFAGMSALAFATILCGSVLFKDAIMKTAPQLERYYATAGLYPSGPDLKISNIVTTKSQKDGIARLIVKGEIANDADATVPVPPIQLVMRGKSKASLYEWTVAAAKDELKAGEKSRFTAVAQNFPGEAVDVEVTFARR